MKFNTVFVQFAEPRQAGFAAHATAYEPAEVRGNVLVFTGIPAIAVDALAQALRNAGVPDFNTTISS